MNEQSPKVINAEAQLVNDAAYQTLVENISKAVEIAHQKLATAVKLPTLFARSRATRTRIAKYIIRR